MGVLFIKTVTGKHGVYDCVTVGDTKYYICSMKKVFFVFSADRDGNDCTVHMFVEHSNEASTECMHMRVLSNIVYGYGISGSSDVFTKWDKVTVQKLQNFCLKLFSVGAGRGVVPVRVHGYEDQTVRMQYLGNPAIILFRNTDAFRLLSLQNGDLYTTGVKEEAPAFEAAMNFINGEWSGDKAADSEFSRIMKEIYWEPVLRSKFLEGFYEAV